MRFPVRSRPSTPVSLPEGPVRHLRRLVSASDGVRPGDVVLVDESDLDRGVARNLVEAGAIAVLNAGPMLSGRFPAHGPQVLVDAGIAVVDQIGPDAFARIAQGSTVRLESGTVHVDTGLSLEGREVDAALLSVQLEQARAGMAAQLESLTHNGTELLRREHELLLDGEGLPALATKLGRRPVVVIADGPDWSTEMRAMRAFLREQRPVVICVGEVADALVKAGHRPDVVVLSERESTLPSSKTLKRATDVVAVASHRGRSAPGEHLERIGVHARQLATSLTAEDAALVLAATGSPPVVVAVGLPGQLSDFLERSREGVASAYVTRLAVGSVLVDATAVPHLYDGAVRPRHVLGVVLAGAVALVTAIGVTPAGQEWVADLVPAITSVIDQIRGFVS